MRIKNEKNNFQRLSAVIGLMFLSFSVSGQKEEIKKIQQIPYNLFWKNKPLAASIKKNEVIITAGPKTDMFRDPNVTYNTDNAPQLLFMTQDPSFVLIASIEHAFVNKWDAGALVLKQDSLNWVKFCFEKDYTGAKRVVSVVTRDISDDCNSVAVEANKIYYKMAKADNVITLYYSEDNSKWYLIRHLQFNSNGPISVGFLAQSPTGSSCLVRFSNIKYQAKKIKDPYAGE